MARIAGTNSHQRRAVLRRTVKKARRLPPLAYCGICGGPIYADAAAQLPGSLCIDHTWPKERYPQWRAEGWNLKPAHRICNEQKGDRDPTPEEARRAAARRQLSPRPKLVVKRRRPLSARRIAQAPGPGSLADVLGRI